MPMSAYRLITSASPSTPDVAGISGFRLLLTQLGHSRLCNSTRRRFPKSLRLEPQQTKVKDEKIDGMKVGSQHRKVYGLEMVSHRVER